MIHLRVIPLDAASEPVPAMRPTQVDAGNIAAIAENERVGRLRIAQIQPDGKDEPRKAVIKAWITQGSRIVRAGDLQIIQSFCRGEVEG